MRLGTHAQNFVKKGEKLQNVLSKVHFSTFKQLSLKDNKGQTFPETNQIYREEKQWNNHSYFQ